MNEYVAETVTTGDLAATFGAREDAGWSLASHVAYALPQRTVAHHTLVWRRPSPVAQPKPVRISGANP